MAANTYLEKFRSTIAQSQGSQLLKLLTKKRDSGEIRTLDEFKQQLTKLTAKLLETRIKPTLSLFTAIGGQDISSEQYNDMLDRIQDDLDTAFEESENLETIMAAHHNLINDVSLRALRFAVNNLEAKITLYEFLDKNSEGFNDALFHTFAASEKCSISRSEEDAALVYVDFRKSELIDISEDCLIDTLGERILLGTSKSAYAQVKKAEWLTTGDSIRSELEVEFENSDINHILDGTTGTYWVESILLTNVKTEGVPLRLGLELSSYQDINFIDIEPASEFPMTISQIQYRDGNDVWQTLDRTEIVISGPTRLNFEKVTTRYLALDILQKNYKEVQFVPQIGASNFYRAVLGQKNFTVDMDSVSEDLQHMLSSDFLLSDIMNIPYNNNSMVKYYQYVIGFDNVRPGYNQYNNRGVFASDKKALLQPGLFALKVEEWRPCQLFNSSAIFMEPHNYSTRTGEEDNKFYHGSVEYWLTIKSFTEEGLLIKTDSIAILPLAAKRVYHERLVLIKRAASSDLSYNQGALRFYCDADSTDVLVYNNGELLTYGTDWTFVPTSGDGSSTILTQESSDQGTRMSRGIWILETISSLNIYTVSYTPKTSNTFNIPTTESLFNIVDLVGDQSIRMLNENMIIMDLVRSSQEVARADIYLTVIMRRNSAVESFSPLLEEFMLLSGSRDSSRFEGIS